MDGICLRERTITPVVEPDWDREKIERWWSPSKQLIKSIRQYQKRKKSSSTFTRLLCYFNVLEHRFWSTITGADIPLNCQLGGGLKLLHPNGIVIHPEARIGVNCLIFQQVTIVKNVEIGDRVDIGAGAKIIRPVSIGYRAKIGANAVVLEDVPARATAVGVPAKVIN